jgi:hypothetical protein
MLYQRKAYDRVSHDWLHRCLTTFGFPPRMRDLIVSLNTTASARIAMNGFLSKPVPQGSGLHQGCPLLPPLYNLTLEPLNRYLQNPRLSGIEGISIGTARVTNICFADDTSLFGKANDIPRFASALTLYHRALGGGVERHQGRHLGAGEMVGRSPPPAPGSASPRSFDGPRGLPQRQARHRTWAFWKRPFQQWGERSRHRIGSSKLPSTSVRSPTGEVDQWGLTGASR